MGLTATAPPPAPQTAAGAGLVGHYWCCNIDRALCGHDLTGAPYADPETPDCPPCTRLLKAPCRPGCPWPT